MRKLVLLCLASLAAWPLATQAQHCRSTSVVRRGRVIATSSCYAQRAVVVNHAYVAPTYVSSAFLLVPQVTYPLYGTGYSGDLSELTNIRTELQKLREALTGLDGQGVPQAPVQAIAQPAVQPVQPSSIAPATQPAPPANPATAAPINFDRAAMFATVSAKCAKCHGPTRQEKGLMLTSADGKGLNTALTQDKLLRVFYRSARGDMPPKGQPPLEQNELDLLDLWVQSVAK